MRHTKPLTTVSTAAALAVSLLAAPFPAFATPAPQADPTAQTARQPLERQVLPENDGWAAAGVGTTGGSAAGADRVYDVSSRTELLAAFASGGMDPKIIRVHGDIAANVDASGSPLSCEDYASGTGFSLRSTSTISTPPGMGQPGNLTAPRKLRGAQQRHNRLPPSAGTSRATPPSWAQARTAASRVRHCGSTAPKT